jgi:ATP-dependent 26S proteasome regulatory subunit
MFAIREDREEVTFFDFEKATLKILSKYEEGEREAGVMYT